MTKPTHLSTLRRALRAVNQYRAQLETAPRNEWPTGWDSVTAAEVLSELAHDVHVFDRGADVPAHGRKGIAAVPAFLGAFWHTVETLLELMSEPQAVRLYMDSAARMLRSEIQDHSEA